MDINRLRFIDKTWHAISGQIRPGKYNVPLNRAEEKSRVKETIDSARPYNPQFVYEEPPSWPVDKVYAFMRTLRPEESLAEELFFDAVLQTLDDIRRVKTRLPEIITSATGKVYGIPDAGLVKAAWEILRKEEAAPTRENATLTVSAEEAATFFSTSLRQIGLEGWRVVVASRMNARASINKLDRLVKLRKDADFSQDAIRRLLLHEIGTHVLRYHNGNRQFLQIFAMGLPGYLATEEGLAVYNEERYQLLESKTLRKYAGRVIAASLALNHSFWEVLSKLVDYLGVEEAFEVVARAKRGFTDTSAHGAHLKDIIYLKGWLEVRQHLEANLGDYELLYVGKVGLEHIDLVVHWLNQGLLVFPGLLPDEITVTSAGHHLTDGSSATV